MRYSITAQTDKRTGATNKRVRTAIIIAGALLTVVAFVSLFCGAAEIKPSDFLSLLNGADDSSARILRYIRIPRVAAGIFAGAGLACAGVIIQSLLANPLAGPNIIGVNSGAGFFVVLCGALFPKMYRMLPAAAFLGAFLTVIIVFALGRRTGGSRSSVILAGIAISSLWNAATDLIYTLDETSIIGGRAFRTGGLGAIRAEVLPVAAIIIAVCIIITLLFGTELEILMLGDDIARSLGLSTARYRLLFLMLAAGAAGAAVSFAGLIGFVGLIVPHIARRIVGEALRPLITMSILLGAVLVTFCDLLARTVFSPFELPVGIPLSFLGVPFFIYILAKRRSHCT